MTSSTVPLRASRRPRTRSLPVGWILAALAVAWAVAVHHGVGPVPAGGPSAWYEPRGWLLDALAATSLGAWLDPPRRALVAFSVPAFALAVAVFATTRSALARTLAVAALLATGLYLYYGLGGNRTAIWTFFGWRGSAVMTLFALVMSAALCAPLLGASWLRRGWPLGLALYLPIASLVVVALRDVTGTNPRLSFAISPWPVVTMFGIEIGASVVVALIASLALLLALGAASRLAPGSRAVTIALALGSLTALAIVVRPDPGLTLALTACALAVAALAVVARLAGASGGVAATARASAVGALLGALPIGVGLAWVERDYAITRDGAAREINEALRRYFEREQGYPDTLDALVTAKDLPAVPRPQIGFGVDGAPSFTYQNFGMSYLLEFSAPRWVQCAYNPPWAEDELEEQEESEASAPLETPGNADSPPSASLAANDGEAEVASDSRHGSWSCPRRPPELW